MNLRLRALSLLLLAAGFAHAADAPRTVILVRHADREREGVSDAGRCRAEGLARLLADAGVTEIFTTEAPRTQQTAEPLSKKLGIAPQVMLSKDVVPLVAKLRSESATGAALVVGHADTVPEIINKLGGGRVPPIGKTELDRLFVMTVPSSGPSVPVTLHYPGCKP